ncbi:MAG: glycosyltransferase family 1 protein [Candidatus Competibacteraceae bacterium]
MPRTIRRVLCYRDYRGFTGGHLKVRDYLRHLAAAPAFQPELYLTPDSVTDAADLWTDPAIPRVACWQPAKADVLFLAGLDWRALTETEREQPRRPVLNLIQHPRHADPADPRHAFLHHRAIRIAVSPEVGAALRGRVNGPLFTIPNGLDLASLPRPMATWEERPIELLIAGLKRPALARQFAAALSQDTTVRCLTDALPRAAFLEQLGSARITVFLPHATEGFYLPALEGMALGTLVICPDCVANRLFCRDAENCLMPADARPPTLLAAVARARRLSPSQRSRLLAAARRTAEEYDIALERQRFHALLADLDQLW